MLLTLGLTVGEIGAAIGRLLKRLVYAFDSDYLEIPQANLIAGDAVEFKFISEPVTNYDYFFDGPDSIQRLYLHTGGSRKFVFNSGRTASIQLDGGTLVTVSDTLTVPEDGLEHTVRVVFSDVGKVGKIASPYNVTASDLANLPIYDFSITAASGDRFYAINDNSQNIKNALDTSTPRFRYDFDPTANARIPALALEAGDVVLFKFVMDDLADIANKFFMAAQDSSFNVSVRTDGFWNLFGSSGHTSTIDGNPLVNGTTHLGQYADGREHVIQITVGASVADVVTIASAASGGQDYDGIMYDVEFTVAAGNRSYAIDDNSQTLVDSVSGQDGTIENYNAASWKLGNLTDGTIINYDPTHWVRNN